MSIYVLICHFSFLQGKTRCAFILIPLWKKRKRIVITLIMCCFVSFYFTEVILLICSRAWIRPQAALTPQSILTISWLLSIVCFYLGPINFENQSFLFWISQYCTISSAMFSFAFYVVKR